MNEQTSAELNCRDDAKNCPTCSSDFTAMVNVLFRGDARNKKKAVACFDCGARGLAKDTMHDAVVSWNKGELFR